MKYIELTTERGQGAYTLWSFIFERFPRIEKLIESNDPSWIHKQVGSDVEEAVELAFSEGIKKGSGDAWKEIVKTVMELRREAGEHDEGQAHLLEQRKREQYDERYEENE